MMLMTDSAISVQWVIVSSVSPPRHLDLVPRNLSVSVLIHSRSNSAPGSATDLTASDEIRRSPISDPATSNTVCLDGITTKRGMAANKDTCARLGPFLAQ